MFPALDPTAYFSLATELASRPEPVANRSAADRAYYAAFLYSRDELAKKGYMTPYYSLEDHKYVPQILKTYLGAIGNDESRLRKARNTITYDTRDLTRVSTLRWMIETAGVLMEQVRSLPQRSEFTT